MDGIVVCINGIPKGSGEVLTAVGHVLRREIEAEHVVIPGEPPEFGPGRELRRILESAAQYDVVRTKGSYGMINQD